MWLSTRQPLSLGGAPRGPEPEWVGAWVRQEVSSIGLWASGRTAGPWVFLQLYPLPPPPPTPCSFWVLAKGQGQGGGQLGGAVPGGSQVCSNTYSLLGDFGYAIHPSLGRGVPVELSQPACVRKPFLSHPFLVFR